MTEPSLIRRQQQLLQTVIRLTSDRAAAETAAEEGLRSRNEAAEQGFQEASRQVAERYAVEKPALETEYRQTMQALQGRLASERSALEKEYAEARQRTQQQFTAVRDKAVREADEGRWTISTLYEAKKNEAREKIKKTQRTRQKIANELKKVNAVADQAREQLLAWGRRRELAEIKEVPSHDLPPEGSLRELRECVSQADSLLAQLKALAAPRFCKTGWYVIFFVVPFAAAVYPAILFLGWRIGLGGSAGLALAAAISLAVWLSLRARSQVRRFYRPLCRALADARLIARQCDASAVERINAQVAETTAAKKCRNDDLAQHKEKYQRLLAEITARRDAELRDVEAKYPRLLAELKQQGEQQLAQTDQKYRRLLTEVQERYARDSRQLQETRERQLAESQARYAQEREVLARTWHQGLAQWHKAVAEIQAECGQRFPNWSDPLWQTWQPPTAVPSAIRFGEFTVDLAQLPGGLPADEALRPRVPLTCTLPALLSFPRRCSMLFKAQGEGRAQAVQALQAVMLRLLTGLPAGKVRFTIIDPVGLGENFAAFMQLADFDEALVNSRIWTEQQHIEQRLADLTEHMETVIQKYLRNQYSTIEDYNAAAGEVAEPYRVLVVANFPTNFTVEAARRLVAIASSGASCGVYTLISVDGKQPLPEGIHLKDLESPSVTLTWKEQRFVWKDPDFGGFPLKLDAPPGASFFLDVLQRVGEKARLANRVEVLFDFVAPPPEEVWKSDSRAGIRVALGKAGATKRQLMQLGQGTAQHALIAGKTGSGKSTLLHALITNLCLCYSPEEIELYLVDFKKGVEFKTYAAHALPHARVVAIESEREFGLSVLQRLDAELKARGERFRAAQVQNINDYRNAVASCQLSVVSQGQDNGPSSRTTGNWQVAQVATARCPRILLIVDEFQEFFVEDDRIAQEAALLLDRLVRQGRAFGLHVLLGSQTLGGAYSLARSTIDQMAVRIALQCSEADAYLILSKDNAAARLLSRPGEAIYNDANGLLEGNDLFQVVWLPDERREHYLTQLQELARQRNLVPPQPQIVFEGNAPADIERNPLLSRLLREASWPAAPRAAHAWLGEAIAIKDPTAAIFRPQSSNNLLIVGQQDEMALSLTVSALVSLAAQHAPAEAADRAGGAKFYVLDGTPVDSPLAGYLSRLPELVPHSLKVASWRELPGVLAELAGEVDRRQKEPEAIGPSLYLFIHGLHRFRDLRKAEDDFGFSRRVEEKAASPAKQLGTILREGPAVGVFSLVWCDTLNNVNRSLDRHGLREFEMRVLMQMSVADSSTLIDSPAASKLGMNRALFFSEDCGQPEKFRPYGLPPESWLRQVQKQLHSRLAAAPA
jgi:hypothetical protein